MTFSKFDFDVITDPGAQRERVPWIPLHRPKANDDAAEPQETGAEAGQAQPAPG